MSPIDCRSDPVAAIAAVVAGLDRGRAVAIPTDTVYGLAVRAGDPDGVAELFRIKQRPADLKVAVLVASRVQAHELVEEPGPQLEPLLRRFWPGALTVVLPAADGTLGVRCPDHGWLRRLLAETGPLATTSANRHGQPPLERADLISEEFGAEVAVVIDGGSCAGAPSTVVAAGPDGIRVLREGAISAEAIRGAARVD